MHNRFAGELPRTAHGDSTSRLHGLFGAVACLWSLTDYVLGTTEFVMLRFRKRRKPFKKLSHFTLNLKPNLKTALCNQESRHKLRLLELKPEPKKTMTYAPEPVPYL